MAPKDTEQVQEASPEKKPPISVPITPGEEKILQRLIANYQDAVTERNRKTGQTESANIHVCEIMRAGLAALAPLTPEKLRVLVSKLERKKKGRPRRSSK